MVLLAACDRGEGVTYMNDTNVTVSVFSGRDLDVTLAPGEQGTFTVLAYEGMRTYSARDESGQVIFREEYTWEDLKRMDWEIVIRDE